MRSCWQAWASWNLLLRLWRAPRVCSIITDDWNCCMSVVVMKFGGTSVEDPAAITRTAGIVAGRLKLGKRPVVVVSALAKVTDQLLRAATSAAAGDRTGALAISSRLRCRHRDTAAALMKDSAELSNYIDQKFDSLDEILRGLAAILEMTPRISDLVVSYGERISSRIVA